MLKRNPKARSAQQNKKTRRATIQTALFLILLTSLTMIQKRSRQRLKKEIFTILLAVISEDFLRTIRKSYILAIFTKS